MTYDHIFNKYGKSDPGYKLKLAATLDLAQTAGPLPAAPAGSHWCRIA